MVAAAAAAAAAAAREGTFRRVIGRPAFYMYRSIGLRQSKASIHVHGTTRADLQDVFEI
jgi:hypothetical protein